MKDMRQIKFRAWDIEGFMLEVNSIDFKRKTISGIRSDTHGWTDNFDAFVLMQFTGLLDKNGKEVYAGDVVRYTYASTPPEVRVGPVEWSDEYLGWRFAELLIEPTPQKTMEVIGNIHENPELLKV
jgi:uncharacterized phage protein (TIGR01671 family)